MINILEIFQIPYHYLNDYYEGVKRLMIPKLFDLREPSMTREYA